MRHSGTQTKTRKKTATDRQTDGQTSVPGAADTHTHTYIYKMEYGRVVRREEREKHREGDLAKQAEIVVVCWLLNVPATG